jgi:hypothetical protein
VRYDDPELVEMAFGAAIRYISASAQRAPDGLPPTATTRAFGGRASGYRTGMTEIEREHPDDPAEGADFDEEQTDDGTRQNEERELNSGDDVTRPGGDEPTD